MEFGIETGRFGRGRSFIRNARAGAFLPLLVIAACSGKTGPDLSPVASAGASFFSRASAFRAPAAVAAPNAATLKAPRREIFIVTPPPGRFHLRWAGSPSSPQ